MIVRDSSQPSVRSSSTPGSEGRAELPAGLPQAAEIRRIVLAEGRPFDALVVPCDDDDGSVASPRLAAVAHAWITAAGPSAPSSPGTPTVVSIPLYGCHVIWAPGRGAVVGSAARVEPLAMALVEFAAREADLRDLEHRGSRLIETIDGDASAAFEFDERLLGRRPELAGRFREAVAVRRSLALLAPAVHVPPVHPPTLASQLGERLRDRTRLAERHELATDRADFALQVYEACGQRASEFGIARRQMGLEWAIIVLLVAQTILAVVELLASRSST